MYSNWGIYVKVEVHTCDAAVDCPGEGPHALSSEKLPGQEDGHTAGAAGQQGRQHGRTDSFSVVLLTDGSVGPTVKGHESEDENEAPQGHQRNGMSRNVLGVLVAKPVNAWTQNIGTCNNPDLPISIKLSHTRLHLMF